MENMIFAALLYILVPVFLLWLNHGAYKPCPSRAGSAPHECARVNRFVDTQLQNDTTATNLSHQSTINHDIKPAFTESNLLNYNCPQAQLGDFQHERSHLTNINQKTSENLVEPTIQKLESEENQPDYHQLTIRQLKKIAQKRKIKRYGTMKKQDLIFALKS